MRADKSVTYVRILSNDELDDSGVLIDAPTSSLSASFRPAFRSLAK